MLRYTSTNRVGLAPCSALLIGYSMPAPAAACNETQRLCVTYQTDLADDQEGQLGQFVLARGARVTVIRPPPEPPLGFYLDEEGCGEFPTQYAAGHTILVYPSAVLGGTKNIRVSSFDWDVVLDEESEIPDLGLGDITATVPDTFEVGPIADGSDIMLDVLSSSETANLMAVATHAVHALDSMTGTVLNGEHELTLVRLVNVPGFAFYNSFFNRLAVGEGADRYKFIVGHEIGHWLQMQAQIEEGSSGFGNVDYFYPWEVEGEEHRDNTGNILAEIGHPYPACQFAVEYDAPEDFPVGRAEQIRLRLQFHGIRSAEYSSAAMVEGFAHFVASAAFNPITNESGTFRYYKDIDLVTVPAYQDLEDAGGLVALPGTDDPMADPGDRAGWLKLNCEPDWDVLYFDAAEQIPSAVSSEIDWLRLYWEFLTSQDTELDPQPGFWDVVRLVAYTQKEYPWDVVPVNPGVWENLVQTLGDNASGLTDYANRFDALNDKYQVWHDPTE